MYEFDHRLRKYQFKIFYFQRPSMITTSLFKWEGDWSFKILKNFPDLKNILLSDVTGKYNKEELEKNLLTTKFMM